MKPTPRNAAFNNLVNLVIMGFGIIVVIAAVGISIAAVIRSYNHAAEPDPSPAPPTQLSEAERRKALNDAMIENAKKAASEHVTGFSDTSAVSQSSGSSVSSSSSANVVTLPSGNYSDCSAIELKIEYVEDFFGLSWSPSYKTHMLPYQRVSFDMYMEEGASPNVRRGRLQGEVAGRSRCTIDVDTNIGRLHAECGMPLVNTIEKFERALIAGTDYNAEKAKALVYTLNKVWSDNTLLGDNITLSYTYKKGDSVLTFDDTLIASAGLEKSKTFYQSKLHNIIDVMAVLKACEMSRLTEEQLLLELR